MNTTERIAAVRATIAKLSEIADPDKLIYRPDEFKGITNAELKELVEMLEAEGVDRVMVSDGLFDCEFEFNCHIDGVFVTGKTTKTEVSASGVSPRDRLFRVAEYDEQKRA